MTYAEKARLMFKIVGERHEDRYGPRTREVADYQNSMGVVRSWRRGPLWGPDCWYNPPEYWHPRRGRFIPGINPQHERR